MYLILSAGLNDCSWTFRTAESNFNQGSWLAYASMYYPFCVFSRSHSSSVSSGAKYSRMDQVKFVKYSLWKIWRNLVYLSKPYHFKFLKALFHRFYLVHSWILCPIWSPCFFFITEWPSLDTSCRETTS